MRVLLAWFRRHSIDMLFPDDSGVVAVEGAGSRADFIEHDAKSVDVTTLGSRIALGLLWRDIEGCIIFPATECASGCSQQQVHTEVSEHRLAHGITFSIVLGGQ